MNEGELKPQMKLSPEEMNRLWNEGNRAEDGSFKENTAASGGVVFEDDFVMPGQQMGLPSDLASKENVVGVNVASGQVIVKPKKTSDSFVKPMPTPPSSSVAKTSDTVEEMLRMIADTSDFQPFDLPSRGKLYQAGYPAQCGKVLIRPMRGAEEEVLATPRLFRSGEAIDLIFKRCIAFDGKIPIDDPLKLLSLDRMAILIAIRIMTYGPIYDFGIVCGNCRRAFESKIDLDDHIDIYYLDEDSNFSEPLKSRFPECGFEFEYRLGRGFDEMESIKYNRERERKYGGKATDDSFMERAKRLVTAIGGFTERKAIDGALALIKGNDLQHLRECIENPPFGADTRIVLECPYCMADNKMRLPLSADFFTPRLREMTEISSTQD